MNPQIKLTTNRYVILDDPNKNYASVTASADTGFGLPGSWNTDTWNNESTTIRGVALVLNAEGAPASGVTVTFAVLDWDDSNPRNPLKSDTNSKTNVTNSYGLATVPFNLNNEQQYGNWKITATATVAGTPVSSTSNFVYNWWGCQNCHGSPYSNTGKSEGYTSRIGISNRYDPYSPYITGRDFHATMYRSDHVAGSSSGRLEEGECWACHNSYDKDLNLGQERPDNGASYTGKGVPSTIGVHTNLECAECHSIIGTSSSGVDQTVKSCDAIGCHSAGSANNSNSHIGQETVTATSPNKYVNYSGLDVTLGIRTFSDPSYIPTEATFNSNPLTGARAHTSATVQNIPCTVCHGPMHNVTKPDASTVPKNPVTEDTQCTTCHQSLKHSSNNPVYCTACHSQDAHTIKVLGTDGTYKDRGSAGAITSGVSDCVICHNSGAADNFLGNLTVLDSQAYTENYDPAGKYLNQHPSADCTNSCHDTSNFHNISSVGGGPECLSCHNSTGSANHRVDGNAINAGMHANLNAKDPVNPNSKCWGCHQSDGNEPQSSMGDIFNTPYNCVDCHLSTGVKSGAYGAFIVNEHYPSGNDIKVIQGNNLSACIQCHNKSEMKVNYISPDNLFTNYSLVSHYGKNRNELHNLNETNCSYCHQNTSEFNDIFNKMSNTQITHNNGKSCYICHREKGQVNGRIHDSPLLGGGGESCLQCHSIEGGALVVDSMDLGSHINLNITVGGTGNLTNEDCNACHYSNPHPGTNISNTYYCYDCHNKSTGGRAPIRSSIKFDDELHGELTCINCHIADGRYHQGNPRGSVANSTYISRYTTDKINTTDCGDCHRAANLDDAPFNAPGGGTHIDSCATNNGGCHSGNTFVIAVHKTTPLDNINKKPSITTPALDHLTVTKGTEVNVTVTVNVPTNQALVDGAQYRIMSGTTEIRPWTPMNASDGNFNSTLEVAAGRINTDFLSGIYDIEVRGMGGGPAQDPLVRYYPMNGDISSVKTAILTVQPLGGFITGTITSGLLALEGALVTTSGASDITGADGIYSLSLPPGIYNVTASKLPEYNDNTTFNIEVIADTTSDVNMSISLKPTGNITGTITNI